MDADTRSKIDFMHAICCSMVGVDVTRHCTETEDVSEAWPAPAPN